MKHLFPKSQSPKLRGPSSQLQAPDDDDLLFVLAETTNSLPLYKKKSVPQWGDESSLTGLWLPATGGDGAWGHGRPGRAPGRCGCAVTGTVREMMVEGHTAHTIAAETYRKVSSSARSSAHPACFSVPTLDDDVFNLFLQKQKNRSQAPYIPLGRYVPYEAV